MKVEEERLRLARDLPDLLGQTLLVITLKSELARGLITEDPARCAQELSEKTSPIFVYACNCRCSPRWQ